MLSQASVAKKITLTLLALLAVLALVASAVLIVQKDDSASAVKASDFNPGRIIDDAVFYNAGAMTANQIQTFLNAKNPYCDTNGTGRATDWGRPDITRATLASYIRNGTHGYNKNTNFHAPPYTCLKDFKQNTPQVAAASGLCEAIPARSSRTAAQIIHDVAQACGINPQVFLVLLEKEQSLVTDIWPLNLQYQRATGFACPDNVGGACDPSFNGFFRQVYAAGRQFKLYQSRPNDYNYRAGVTNNIFWQTNGGNFVSDGRAASRRNGQCGYSRVRIENQATAALYIYTPYRPNQAAMANYPGTGDACSAYGNRNFWFMFNNWFGSTQEQFKYNFEDLVGSSGVIKNETLLSGEATKVVAIGNNIYNLYADSANKSLRLAHWDGSRWSDQAVDGKSSAIRGSLNTDMDITDISAFDYNGQLQAFYYDNNSKSLRHLFTRGDKIILETLDGTTNSVLRRDRNVGSGVSSMLLNGNNIQLFYYNTDSKSLEHTWWDPRRSRWSTETLDGTNGSVLGKNRNVGTSTASMAYGVGGIQLFYYNTDSKSLEHTWWDPRRSRWSTETLDGIANSLLKGTDDVGSEVSGLVYGDNIQLFYHNLTTGELIHTWWNSGRSSWHTERMDGDRDTLLGNYINSGKKIDMAIFQGRLFVAYYDDASIFSRGDKLSSWRLTYWSGSSWIQHTLEGGGGLSNPTRSMPLSSISLAPYGDVSLQIFYKGADGQLRHSWVRK